YGWFQTNNPSRSRRNARTLIWHRLLGAVDDQHVDRPLRRFELQPQLLLNSREDGGRVAVCDRWRRAGVGRQIPSGRTDAGIRRVRELDVVRPCESGLVDDDSPGKARERLREHRHRLTADIDSSRADHETTPRPHARRWRSEALGIAAVPA